MSLSEEFFFFLQKWKKTKEVANKAIRKKKKRKRKERKERKERVCLILNKKSVFVVLK